MIIVQYKTSKNWYRSVFFTDHRKSIQKNSCQTEMYSPQEISISIIYQFLRVLIFHISFHFVFSSTDTVRSPLIPLPLKNCPQAYSFHSVKYFDHIYGKQVNFFSSFVIFFFNLPHHEDLVLGSSPLTEFQVSYLSTFVHLFFSVELPVFRGRFIFTRLLKIIPL